MCILYGKITIIFSLSRFFHSFSIFFSLFFFCIFFWSVFLLFYLSLCEVHLIPFQLYILYYTQKWKSLQCYLLLFVYFSLSLRQHFFYISFHLPLYSYCIQTVSCCFFFFLLFLCCYCVVIVSSLLPPFVLHNV